MRRLSDVYDPIVCKITVSEQTCGQVISPTSDVICPIEVDNVNTYRIFPGIRTEFPSEEND